MDLRQRLRLLTKLDPEPSPSGTAPAAQGLYPNLGFALPTAEHNCQQPLPALASLAAPCLLPDLKNFPWEQAVFVDTETTGLSTGTGTYVFLSDIGTVNGGILKVRQYFLPDPARESGFWRQVLPELRAYPLLCTFNGKSYDLPLINTRLTLMGLPGLEPSAHLDLLYPARRLWRKVLPSCALQSLEEYRLHTKRVDDVPGEIIPSVYYNYLQDGNRKPLEAIFAHNRQDIVSLFELTAQMASNCSQPRERFARAEEFFGLAEAQQRSGQLEQAAEMIICGLERPGDERQKRLYLHKLAKLQVRIGQYSQAADTWREAAGLEPLSPTPRIELAKLCEHRLRDLPAAWRAAQQAALVCRRRKSLGVPIPQAEEEALTKRLQRLERRLQRAAESDEGVSN